MRVRRDVNSRMLSRWCRLGDTLAPPRQKLSVDRERERTVAADEYRPHDVGLKAPSPVLTAHALADNIGDQARRARALHRRRAVRPKQAECRHKTCVVLVRRGDLQVVNKMPGGHRPAPTAPRIELADLVVPGELVLADHIQPIREIKLVGIAPAVQVDILPVVGFEPVEGVPQPRVGGVTHACHLALLPRRERSCTHHAFFYMSCFQGLNFTAAV